MPKPRTDELSDGVNTWEKTKPEAPAPEENAAPAPEVEAVPGAPSTVQPEPEPQPKPRRGRRKKKVEPPEPQPAAIDPAILDQIRNMPVGMMLKGTLDPFIMAVDRRLPGLTEDEVATLDASGKVLMAQYGEAVAKYAPALLFIMQMSGIVMSRYLMAKQLKAEDRKGNGSEQEKDRG